MSSASCDSRIKMVDNIGVISMKQLKLTSPGYYVAKLSSQRSGVGPNVALKHQPDYSDIVLTSVTDRQTNATVNTAFANIVG